MSRLALGHTHPRNHHHHHPSHHNPHEQQYIPTLITTTTIIVIIGLVQHFKVIIEISNLSKSKQDHSSKGIRNAEMVVL